MLVRIKPEQAELGMYVSSLQCAWLSHSFWRGRFLIASNDDLMRVRNEGVELLIDTDRGRNVAPSKRSAPTAETDPGVRPRSGMRAAAAADRTALQPRKMLRRLVPPPAFGTADKARAVALAQRSTKVVRELFEDCRLGQPVAVPQILTVVGDIAETLERNSAAFMNITRLKSKDDYTYTHSVAVCALMIVLARETGVSSEMVHNMGVAGLLHDIGKMSIDKEILQKVDELDDEERAQIALHPEKGHAVLAAETSLPAVALDVCLHHHERIDGSGYPFGLHGDSVTAAVRMAAICDVYDAMTSNRPYKKGKSPMKAIAEMEASVGEFDSNLLFRFMRSLGVFPPGKLIRLRSNRLAVTLPVASSNSRPVARAFYETVGGSFVDYEDVVLSDRLNEDQAVSQEDPAAWFSIDWAPMSARIKAGAQLPVT